MDGNTRKDIFIGIALFGLLLLSLFTGGISQGTNLNPPTVTLETTGTSASISQSSNRSDGEPAWPLIPSRNRGGTQTEEELTEKELRGVEAEIRKLERSSDVSPYKDSITLGRSTSGPKNRDVNREYIEIRSSGNNSARIPISGWRLESKVSGRLISIPEATYLPRNGEKSIDQPVWLSPGERAFIVTGRSPIGISFRNNICAGYFTQFQRFEPFLSKQCPEPEDDILFYTDDRTIFIDNVCMDFVDRISRCSVVTKLPLELSHSCGVAVIEQLNYNKCIDNHKDDSNFIEEEWYLYLKRVNELWRDKRELIVLYDHDGKVVDSLTY